MGDDELITDAAWDEVSGAQEGATNYAPVVRSERGPGILPPNTENSAQGNLARLSAKFGRFMPSEGDRRRP